MVFLSRLYRKNGRAFQEKYLDRIKALADGLKHPSAQSDASYQPYPIQDQSFLLRTSRLNRSTPVASLNAGLATCGKWLMAEVLWHLTKHSTLCPFKAMPGPTFKKSPFAAI
jgi:hypothetical protein